MFWQIICPSPPGFLETTLKDLKRYMVRKRSCEVCGYHMKMISLMTCFLKRPRSHFLHQGLDLGLGSTLGSIINLVAMCIFHGASMEPGARVWKSPKVGNNLHFFILKKLWSFCFYSSPCEDDMSIPLKTSKWWNNWTSKPSCSVALTYRCSRKWSLDKFFQLFF